MISKVKKIKKKWPFWRLVSNVSTYKVALQTTSKMHKELNSIGRDSTNHTSSL